VRFSVRIFMVVWVGAVGGLALVTLVPRLVGAPSPLAAYTNCAVPCFLGIIPGETTATEAEYILETHPDIYITYRSADRGTLMWHYRRPVPLHFDVADASRLDYDPITGRVREILLNVRMPLWRVATDVHLLPTQSVVMAENRGYLLVSNPQHGVATWTASLDTCPRNVGDLWRISSRTVSLYGGAGTEAAVRPLVGEVYWWECT